MTTTAPPPAVGPAGVRRARPATGPFRSPRTDGRRSPLAILGRIWRDTNGRIGLIITVSDGPVGAAGDLRTVAARPDRAESPGPLQSAVVGPYWFGTDQFGRDIAARTFSGIFTSLRVSAGVGDDRRRDRHAARRAGRLPRRLGGPSGRPVHRRPVRLPGDPAGALPLVSALGSGWFNTSIAIAVVYTPIFARVARGPTLSVAQERVHQGRAGARDSDLATAVAACGAQRQRADRRAGHAGAVLGDPDGVGPVVPRTGHPAAGRRASA